MANFEDAPLAGQPKAINSVLAEDVPYSGIAEGARAFGAGVSFLLIAKICECLYH